MLSDTAIQLRAVLEQNVSIARHVTEKPPQELPALQQWQRDRLEYTYQDFADQANYAYAVRFFLEDLYAPEDMVKRDTDLLRIFPAMHRLLSDELLGVVLLAIRLQILSMQLDLAMCDVAREEAIEVHAQMTDHQYAHLYSQVGRWDEREQQLELLHALGGHLIDLVANKVVYRTLKACRFPARWAGLGELQSFLERGFDAFHAMPEPETFVAAVYQREGDALRAIRSEQTDVFGFRP